MKTRSLRSPAIVFSTLVTLSAFQVKSPVPGIRYTMRFRETQSDSGPRGNSSEHTSWTGTVFWASGRGRVDLTEGGQAGLFEKGDYVLFDSSDYIIVRPDQRAYFVIPEQLPGKAMQSISALSTVKRQVEVSADTLGDGPVLDGMPTRRYRTLFSMKVTFGAIDLGADEVESGVDVSTLPKGFESLVQTDYWCAKLGGFPPRPFVKVSTGVAPTANPDSGKLKMLGKALPPDCAPVRTVERMGTVLGSSRSLTIDTTEVSSFGALELDASRLVLPAGYRPQMVEGLQMFYTAGPPTDSAGRKWRAVPWR